MSLCRRSEADILLSPRAAGLHPLVFFLGAVHIIAKYKHSQSRRVHWNGALGMKSLLTALVLFETFSFWPFANVEGVCFQRNIVARGQMLTVLCLKQADINYVLLAILLLWITLKGPSNCQSTWVCSQCLIIYVKNALKNWQELNSLLCTVQKCWFQTITLMSDMQQH